MIHKVKRFSSIYENRTGYKVFIEVSENVFVQVCNSQGCGMVIAKTVFLLTQQVVFDAIIVQSCAQHFWNIFDRYVNTTIGLRVVRISLSPVL